MIGGVWIQRFVPLPPRVASTEMSTALQRQIWEVARADYPESDAWRRRCSLDI